MWPKRQSYRQGHTPASASLYDLRENYILLSMYNILIFKIKKRKPRPKGPEVILDTNGGIQKKTLIYRVILHIRIYEK